MKKDDLWRVRERNDYAANYNEISDFLLKARDLKVLRSEQVGAVATCPGSRSLPGQGHQRGHW